MANTILITANWHTGALSQQTISRQYDNNRYAVRFVGYPEASDGNELDYYLLVWMSTAPGQKPGEITPIQLNSDQWYISNYFTQQVQVIKFQLCVLNEAGTYEAHSPIFSGRIGDSLEHNGTSHDIDVSTLFDAYREYIEELIIGAGAMIIDPTPTQGSSNAVSSGGVWDEITDLKKDINENENILRACDNITLTVTKGNLINGEYIKLSNGTIVADDNYSRSDYLPIWYASTLFSTTKLSNCAFYDKDKKFISSGAIANTGRTIPDKAYYVILSSTYTAITTAIVTCISTTLKQQIDEADITGDVFGSRTIVDAKTLLQNVVGVTKYPNNLVNVTDCINNRYINSTTGDTSSGSDYFCTGYIPVEEGIEYKSNAGRNLAWYDTSKTYISGVSGTAIQNGVTAPTNAAFIRFSINKTSDGISSPVYLYFTASSSFRNDVIIDGLADAKPWCYGKTINWLGDSIVAGDDFDEFVSNALHLTETDYGIGGSTIALKEDGTDGRNACCERYANMSDNADIIAVSAGTNDWMYAWCPIGDINSTSKQTFYGALKALCEGLITKYPKKTIFFTTPIKRAQAFEDGNGGEYTEDGIMTTPFSKNKYGKTLMDYADIIIEVCGYYSIPVLDLYRQSMLNPHLSAQQNLFDSYRTHPLDAGRIMMARRVCGWISQLSYNIT